MNRPTRLSLLSLLILASLASGPAHAETTWTELKSNAGKFAMMFPGTPKESSQLVDTDVGKLRMFQYTVETDGGSVGFIALYSDYPSDFMSTRNAQTVLDNVRNGVAGSVKGGTAVDEKRITVQGSPGREFKVAAKDAPNVVFCRIYLVGNRLYQTFVMFPKTAVRQGEVTKFLTSFRLL